MPGTSSPVNTNGRRGSLSPASVPALEGVMSQSRRRNSLSPAQLPPGCSEPHPPAPVLSSDHSLAVPWFSVDFFFFCSLWRSSHEGGVLWNAFDIIMQPWMSYLQLVALAAPNRFLECHRIPLHKRLCADMAFLPCVQKKGVHAHHLCLL